MKKQRLPTREITTIVLFVAVLIAVIVGKSRCGRSVGNMFKALEPPAADAGSP
jgi:hypothetical protein